jgi:hypothetical protein
MLSLISCEQDQVTRSKSYQYTVFKEHWNYTDYTDPDGRPYASNFFYATLNVPELSQDIADKGLVQVYRVIDDVQHLLPMVRHMEELTDTANMVYNFYTETINFCYGTGWIEIDLTQSDFFYEDHITYTPDAMLFRVVLTR